MIRVTNNQTGIKTIKHDVTSNWDITIVKLTPAVVCTQFVNAYCII